MCGSSNGRRIGGLCAHFLKCGKCKIVYNAGYAPLRYDDSYFLEQYKSQYGKTYEEDEDAIRALSSRRIDTIFKVWGRDGDRSALRLLDIGSALGFFLKTAREMNIGSVEGVEISSYAARYCRKKLRINVANASFDDLQLDTTFDIITAWYFIEHCSDPAAVAQKIYALLNINGIFALSVPSFFGPLYYFNRKQWIESHPVDHRIDLSPRSAAGFLKRIGFRKVILRAGGLHPERVFDTNSMFFKPFAAAYTKISTRINFSDTLEIYAIK